MPKLRLNRGQEICWFTSVVQIRKNPLGESKNPTAKHPHTPTGTQPGPEHHGPSDTNGLDGSRQRHSNARKTTRNNAHTSGPKKGSTTKEAPTHDVRNGRTHWQKHPRQTKHKTQPMLKQTNQATSAASVLEKLSSTLLIASVRITCNCARAVELTVANLRPQFAAKEVFYSHTC